MVAGNLWVGRTITHTLKSRDLLRIQPFHLEDISSVAIGAQGS